MKILATWITLVVLVIFVSVNKCDSKKVIKIVVPKKIKYIHHTHVVVVRDKSKQRPYHQHDQHYHHHLYSRPKYRYHKKMSEDSQRHKYKKPTYQYFDYDSYVNADNSDNPTYDVPFINYYRPKKKQQRTMSNYYSSYSPHKLSHSHVTYDPVTGKNFREEYETDDDEEDEDYKVLDYNLGTSTQSYYPSYDSVTSSYYGLGGGSYYGNDWYAGSANEEYPITTIRPFYSTNSSSKNFGFKDAVSPTTNTYLGQFAVKRTNGNGSKGSSV